MKRIAIGAAIGVLAALGIAATAQATPGDVLGPYTMTTSNDPTHAAAADCAARSAALGTVNAMETADGRVTVMYTCIAQG